MWHLWNIAKDCPFRGKCLTCGQAGHLYRDCRNEPVAAATPGPRDLPVEPEDNHTGESMKFDSLVSRTVPAVEFVPASTVSSDGFKPIRRGANRKRARIFECSDIGNVDNCLVNDNKGYTASSEKGETVDITIDDVNSDSNNDTYNVLQVAVVNNDISSGDIISNCVVSDNTTDITGTMVMIMAIPIVVMLIIVRMIKIL